MNNQTEGTIPALSPALARYKLATAWLLQGRPDRARDEFSQLTRSYPEFVPAYLDLGNLLVQAGDRDGARAVYALALAFHPSDSGLRSYFDRLDGECQTHEASANHTARTVDAVRRLGHILLYTDCPGIYGAEQINHLVAGGLVRAGYSVTYAQSRASHRLIREREEWGIQHRWLEDDDIYDRSRTPRAFLNGDAARALFSVAQPDLIIFGNGTPFSNLAAEEAAAQVGLPYVSIVHCVAANWASEYSEVLSRLPFVFERARAVVTVSLDNLDLLHNKFALPGERGQVIYNGRPDVFFRPPDPSVRRRIRGELGIPEGAVVCLTIARMERMKGYQYQVQAIAQLRNLPAWEQIYFIWAGSGTWEGRLRARLIELGVNDHIQFVGERAEIQDWFDAADLFVLPSEFEGMPLSIMEAQAKGLAVVASAVSGIPEEMGDTGKLLPDPNHSPGRTVGEMVETIHAWVKDSHLRTLVGARGRARASAQYRAGRMIDDYLRLIEAARHAHQEPP